MAAAIREANGGSVTCCLHIVLDDQNLRASDVEFCIDYARRHGHVFCVALAEELARHGRHWRFRVGEMEWNKVMINA